MEVDDRELIAEAKAGNKKAFDRLVERYRDKMFALAYRMTGNRDTALDIVQDVFLTVYRELGGFREESSIGSWLYRITSNRTLNHIKRQKIVTFMSMSANEYKEPSYEMNDAAESSEMLIGLKQAVDELPTKQKMAFNLRFYEKLPFNEIARVMNKSESTIKTNYQKAIEKLQTKLKNFR